MAREQDKTYDTDKLETASPHANNDTAGANNYDSPFRPDSPSSARDAGLDDELLEETGDDSDLLEDDLNAADGEFEDVVAHDLEIPITDMDTEPEQLTSPEMSDLNVPGEIDIEELDEHALDDTDLPADARLDPLED